LLFTSGVAGNVGLLLDNVVVSTSAGTSTVPEPSTLSLIGSAILAGIALRRRNSKTKNGKTYIAL
jgi:hypothetical protein